MPRRGITTYAAELDGGSEYLPPGGRSRSIELSRRRLLLPAHPSFRLSFVPGRHGQAGTTTMP